MSWVATAIIAGGAVAGGLGGYYGTSKKNRKEKGTSNAIMGALGGASLGLGGAGLAGAGFMAPAAAGAGGAGSLAGGSGGFGLLSQADKVGLAASGSGGLGSSGSIAPLLSGSGGIEGGLAAEGLTLGGGGTTGATQAATAGKLSQFMNSPFGQGIQMGMAQKLLGGSQDQAVQTPTQFPATGGGGYEMGPSSSVSFQRRMATPLAQMQLELERERMRRQYYG